MILNHSKTIRSVISLGITLYLDVLCMVPTLVENSRFFFVLVYLTLNKMGSPLIGLASCTSLGLLEIL